MLVPLLLVIGSWLLVAGPLFQALVEIVEFREELRDYLDAIDKVPMPEMSGWWWLLPPVAIHLTRMRLHTHLAMIDAVLPPASQRTWSRYLDITQGWILVATGALLVAISESIELAGTQGWPWWALAITLLVPALGVAGFLTAAIRKRIRS